MVLLVRVLFGVLICTPLWAQEHINSSLVKTIPFASLQKHIHPLQKDCRNALREPKIKWNEVSAYRSADRKTIQIKLDGRVDESFDVYFWSYNIPQKSKDNTRMPPVQLPRIKLPLVNDKGQFIINLTVSAHANFAAIPLAFQGSDRFRYLIKIQEITQNMNVIAEPILDRMGEDFCVRPYSLVSLGAAATIQNQTTSPIEADLALSSFSFDRLAYERVWNWGEWKTIVANVSTQSLNFNSFLGASGAQRSIDAMGVVRFTNHKWSLKNSIYRIQYGYHLGGALEQSAYAGIASATAGFITTGMHLSPVIGGYMEMYSRNNLWLTQASLSMQPLYFGIDHKFEGLGLRGTLGVARPVLNKYIIGVQSYFKHLDAKHTGSDDKDNSTVKTLESGFELRFGWLY